MSKGSNVVVIDDKVVIRFMGNDSKEMIMFIAKTLWDKYTLLSVFNRKSVTDDFDLQQARNVYTFYKCACNGYAMLTNEEKELLLNCLHEVGRVLNIKEYVSLAEGFKSSRMALDLFVNNLVSKLKGKGISVCKKDSVSTCSTYLVLDNKMLKSIRLSDHKGEGNEKFKHNVVVNAKEYSVQTEITDLQNTHTTYYVTEDKIPEILKDICDSVVTEKEIKLKKLGEREYNRVCFGNRANIYDGYTKV